MVSVEPVEVEWGEDRVVQVSSEEVVFAKEKYAKEKTVEVLPNESEEREVVKVEAAEGTEREKTVVVARMTVFGKKVVRVAAVES